MLDQVKQTSVSKERLAKISHHFLSDEHTTPETEEIPYVLPIISDPKNSPRFPVYSLSQALLLRGKSSVMLFVESEDHNRPQSQIIQHLDQSFTGNSMLSQLVRDSVIHNKPDIFLIPVTSIFSPYLHECDRILITVLATENGLRHSYISLKRIAALNKSLLIGVTILDAENQQRAQYCFNKLATAAQCFLGVELASYGCLSTTSDTNQCNTDRVPDDMANIADLIILDYQKRSREILSEQARTVHNIASIE